MDKQKKLFRIIPDNFFSPLSSPGKMVYWECIEILFRVSSSQLSFGVERDVLVGELEEYFSSSMSADIEEREYIDEADTGSLSPRDKANLMLRRLEACGWIYTDTDYSYVQRTSFRDYAIAVIRTLLDIEDEHKAEYQGYIYAIYTMARASGNNAVGLKQMVENTDALITGLKSLNANIKIYIDDLTKHSTVSEILDALLNDYYSNVIDREFLRHIHEAYPAAEFMHYGDIDCGGFRIWKTLSEGTGLEIEPYRMDLETYRQYRESGRELTEHDRVLLQEMMEDPFYCGQKELFCEMLEAGLKLEQEVIG